MRDDRPIGAEACSRALETDPAGIEARLKEELKKLGRKIVVLDDDPTGFRLSMTCMFIPTGNRRPWRKPFRIRTACFLF